MTTQSTQYNTYDFANRRHIGPSPAEIYEMLDVIGFPSLEALIDATVPSAIRMTQPLGTGPGLSEHEALAAMKEVAGKNKILTSMIGPVSYTHLTLPTIYSV